MNIINVAHAGVITNAPRVSNIGINVLYFLLSVTGIIAIMALVIAGIMYFISVGNEKSMKAAKNYAQAAILGITIAMMGMIAIKFIGQFFSA